MVGDGKEHGWGSYLRAWSGFLSGALAVAVSIQANYAIAANRCEASKLPVLLIVIGVLVISAAGGSISFAFAREVDPRPTEALRLTSRVSASFALLMALLLLLHLLAVVIFAGCET